MTFIVKKQRASTPRFTNPSALAHASEDLRHRADVINERSALDLLEHLFGEAGLQQRNNDFDDLCKQLVEDLARETPSISPAQMALALRGLASLDPLTLRHYTNLGGLPGLEATVLRQELVTASRDARCKLEDLQAVLLALADATAADKGRTETDLLDRPTAERRDLSKVSSALQQLANANILSQSIAPDRDSPAWQLKYEFLYRSVAELQPRPPRWPALLEMAAGNFRRARGPLGRALALLSPLRQIRLYYEWLRIGLSYGSARSYALLSVLPYAIHLALVVALGFWYREHRENQRAKDERLAKVYWQDIGTPQETDALEELRHATVALKSAFLHAAFAKGNEDSLSHFRPEILDAVMGPQRRHPGIPRQAFKAHCGEEALLASLHPYISACVALAATQSPGDRRKLLHSDKYPIEWTLKLQLSQKDIAARRQRLEQQGATPKPEDITSFRAALTDCRQWTLDLLALGEELPRHAASEALSSLIEVINDPYFSSKDPKEDVKSISLLKKKASPRSLTFAKNYLTRQLQQASSTPSLPAIPPKRVVLLKYQLSALTDT